MRKLTGAVFQSLDGVMQAPGGPEEDPSGGFRFGGWTFPYWDEGMSAPFGKIILGDSGRIFSALTDDKRFLGLPITLGHVLSIATNVGSPPIVSLTSCFARSRSIAFPKALMPCHCSSV